MSPETPKRWLVVGRPWRLCTSVGVMEAWLTLDCSDEPDPDGLPYELFVISPDESWVITVGLSDALIAREDTLRWAESAVESRLGGACQ